MKVWVYSPSTIVTEALCQLLEFLNCTPYTQKETSAEVALWDLTDVSPYPSADLALPTVALVAKYNEDAYVLLHQRYRGYLTPEDGLEALHLALQAARRGEIWAPRTVLTQVLDHSLSTNLTTRETEIRDLVVSGLSNRAIAKTLEIAEPTVKTHVSNIYSKYNVASRAELISNYLSSVPQASNV